MQGFAIHGKAIKGSSSALFLLQALTVDGQRLSDHLEQTAAALLGTTP